MDGNETITMTIAMTMTMTIEIGRDTRDLHRQGHSPGTYCTDGLPQRSLYRGPMYRMRTLVRVRTVHHNITMVIVNRWYAIPG
jgi:hypothetical protein